MGFLYADGNIGTNEHKLELNLSAKDLDHMHKFKLFLKSDAPDRIDTCKGEKYPICRFSVRNRHIWEQLYNKGCVPNKTLILKFPNKEVFAEESLIKHFIRGYMDGDGSLGLYERKSGQMFSLSMAGTEEFLEGVRHYLNESGTLRNASCNAYVSKVFILHYSALKARRVSRKLYENASVYLARKYNIYKSFCQAEEESSVLKSSKIGES